LKILKIADNKRHQTK